MNVDRRGSTLVERRRNEAARWFATLQNRNLSPRVLQKWKTWDAEPENRRTLDEIEQLWRRMDDLPRPRSPTPAELASDLYDGSMSTAEWCADRSLEAAKRRKLLVAVVTIGLAASLAVMGVGLETFLPTGPESTRAASSLSVFETTLGEHDEITLEDGSTVHLGAMTAVTTNISANMREVVLNRGEALFQVAHDPDRPFRVIAGGATITAVGTAFNVRRREQGDVIVTVTEGTVDVKGSTGSVGDDGGSSSANGRKSLTRRIVSGQEITFDASGVFGELRFTDLDIPITWLDGRLQYRSEPLKHVIPDVNRYSRRSLILGDRAAGELLYSGTVFERDVDDWISGLERIYPEVEVIYTDAQHVLIRTRLQPNM